MHDHYRPSTAEIVIVLVCIGILLLGCLTSCGSAPVSPPRLAEVPAQAHVEDLSRRREMAIEASVNATARGDATEATRQRALADELGKLREEAQTRARQERAELAALSREAAEAADARAAEQQRVADRRRALWVAILGCSLAGAGAVIARMVGLPGMIAYGVPGALMTGCAILAGLVAAQAWLAWILGGLAVLLVLGLAGGLAWILLHAVRQWRRSAEAVAAAGTVERKAHDAASIASQPALVRWFLTRVLGAA